MTKPIFDLAPLHSQNIVSAYSGNYYNNVKEDILAKIAQAGYCESDQPEQDYINAVTQNDYIAVLINFILCVVMSFILRTFYVKRSFSLTGKMHIGSIIPILSAVIVMSRIFTLP